MENKTKIIIAVVVALAVIAFSLTYIGVDIAGEITPPVETKQ
jgi:uncharacterized protein YdgA (DUF945 family)